MLVFILGRIKVLVSTTVLASIIVFLVIEAIPGDAASFMLGLNASSDTINALKKELNLNENLILRYFEWILGMCRGNFGISYTYRVPVSDLILERINVSAPLAGYAILITLVLSFPIGVFSAKYSRRTPDYLFMGISQLGISIPNFWFAMILVVIFSINLQWFSAGGFPGWENGMLPAFKALTLPAIALAVPQAAILSRVLRSSLIDTLHQDYVKTARAKGLTLNQIILKHALKNALIPVITILGLQFSFLLSGAIIIENVFFLPGLGRLIFQGILQRDLIVVESLVMILITTVVLINFIVDVVYGVIDPRLRNNGRAL